MIPLPIALKRLIPGYAARWHHRYSALIRDLRLHVPTLTFGETGSVPWIERKEDGTRLHGFWTEDENADAFDLLKSELPAGLRKEFFRLAKDYLTRFVYPHMRPDLRPEGATIDQLWGFHGQHKDSIVDYPDATKRERLLHAFRTKPGETVIDGGAFLGFGDIRFARDTPDCRIVAIEASRDCYELLQRNLTHNGINQIKAYHYGLWSSAGTLDLETGYAQANSLVEEVHKGTSRQTVETVSIDSIIAAEGLSTVSMISLTLNGAEVEAIKGADATLRRYRPRIRLAGWYSRGGRKISDITRDQLQSYDYDVFIGPRGNTMALPKEIA